MQNKCNIMVELWKRKSSLLLLFRHRWCLHLSLWYTSALVLNPSDIIKQRTVVVLTPAQKISSRLQKPKPPQKDAPHVAFAIRENKMTFLYAYWLYQYVKITSMLVVYRKRFHLFLLYCKGTTFIKKTLLLKKFLMIFAPKHNAATNYISSIYKTSQIGVFIDLNTIIVLQWNYVYFYEIRFLFLPNTECIV